MKRLGILVVAVLLIIGTAPFAGAAPTLTFDIDFEQDGVFETGGVYNLAPGSSVVADIIANVTEVGVVGGGFRLEYDASLMSVPGYSFIAPFQNSGLSYNNPGDLGLEARVDPNFGGPYGPGALPFASVEFKCLEIGITEIRLFDFDEETNSWVGAGATGPVLLDDQIPAEGILLAQVNQVPVPAAVWLLGSGLLGLIGIRRHRR